MDNGQFKIVFIQHARSQKRLNDITPLGRWDVRQLFVSGAYLKIYLSDSFQILQTAPLEGLVGVPER